MSNAKFWRGRDRHTPPLVYYHPPLVLLGLPGTGKTTLGRAVAAHYGWEFLDLDAEIERQTGQRIAEIFAAEGEHGFREHEARILRSVLGTTGTRQVLATGGGTPCFHHNMKVLNERGFTVWLEVPTETLIDRLHNGTSTRPLLAGSKSYFTMGLQLIMMLIDRKRFYRQAQLRTAAQTPAHLVAALAQIGFPAPYQPK